jgi:hypothetical protein
VTCKDHVDSKAVVCFESRERRGRGRETGEVNGFVLVTCNAYSSAGFMLLRT